MSKREAFLLRIDPRILEAIRKWSDDDMRSMNAQIEFLLRNQLQLAGRLPSQPKKTQNAQLPKSDGM